MTYISIALNWILFLALFPIAFFWLRRCWRIILRRDFSEVALKRGSAAPNAERYAPYDAVLHLVAGAVILAVIVGVIFFQMPFEVWNALAGSTIVCKLFASFALSRQAHGLLKKKPAASK
jgi:uncharacterized membrane protein